MPRYRWGVSLSPGEVQSCRERAVSWCSYKGNKANLFGGDVEAKTTGLCGELAFKSVLELFNIPFQHGTTDGKADEFDFRISAGMPAAYKIYSVKTQRIPWLPRQIDKLFLHAPQAKHPCDYYAFVRANKDGTWFEVLGEIERDEFLERARLLRAGDITKYGDNKNWVVKADCYYRTIACLRPLWFVPLNNCEQPSEQHR